MQDDWRVTPKLTLNLGFRWDYESPFTERYNKQVAGFCTTCTNPLQSSVTGLTLNGGLHYTSSSNRFSYPRDLNNFQPRLGLAYQMFQNTVVRAGYGIIYFNTLENPIGTGFSQTASYNNYTTNTPINTLANPYPTGGTAAHWKLTRPCLSRWSKRQLLRRSPRSTQEHAILRERAAGLQRRYGRPICLCRSAAHRA